MARRRSAKVTFGTKAETIQKLCGKLRTAVVDEPLVFTAAEWKKNPRKVIDRITRRFPSSPVIVRSSAYAEDSHSQSNAGRFTSVKGVAVSPAELTHAINTVHDTYEPHPKNQIFVQRYITEVEMSGVVFTRHSNTVAPYIIVNYDDASGRTDTVTAGSGDQQKTFIMLRGTDIGRLKIDARLIRVLKTTAELEKLFSSDALDIEFLIKNGVVHVLQVRPITAKNASAPAPEHIRHVLDNVQEHMRTASEPHPDLYGQTTLYGVMPDWNPAEMIGIMPRPLALSLYKELITDSVWAFQRDNYGYKRLRSFPLLLSFAGHPYIDVRVDFNSFIPKAIHDRLAHKLVDFYIEKLRANPAHHDKVEFNVVYTCYAFDSTSRLAELRTAGFSASEVQQIKDSLRDLTNSIIGPRGLCRDDLGRIRKLEERFTALLASPLPPVRKTYWLIEDCKRYGTLPFAGIARAAFIATELLRSLVVVGALMPERRDEFLNSLNTVARQLSEDTNAFSTRRLSKKDFLDRYGHLRPGTYDILSESYAENFSKYFKTRSRAAKPNPTPERNAFTLERSEARSIEALLKEHKLNVSVRELFSFMRAAIEGREHAKFVFTKSISEIFSQIKRYGKAFGFTPEDLSYTEIGTLLKLNAVSGARDEEQMVAEEIARNRATHTVYQHIILPQLIADPADIYSFHTNAVEPNYITRKCATGNVEHILHGPRKHSVTGKIICIESADPGFDWVFSHDIKGFITAYGGTNSHMAIRASELNIPAVIGCGPDLFKKWSDAGIIELDCANKKVVIIR